MPRVPDHVDEGAAGGALALLHAALLAAERRAATLAELSGVLGSTRDPLALVQRAVDLVARATGAVGAFVYLWDRASERLVLKAATEGRQRPYVDAIGLRLGEGVTGWAALMRRHAVINRGLQDDPRFITLPGLGEAEFRSMLAAPILVAGDDILGVFALYSLVEDGFSDDDVSLVDEVATILASGGAGILITHSRTVAASTDRVYALDGRSLRPIGPGDAM